MIVRLSETGPVLLWLQALRLRFKPSTLARQHRSDPDEGFVIAAAPSPSPPAHQTPQTSGQSALPGVTLPGKL